MMFVTTQQKRRRRLGQLIFPDVVTTIATNAALPPAPYQPIWSEGGYVPGAVNPDPSVNTNPSPTVASVGYDLMQVLNDPLAQNPVFNATDTQATMSPAGVASGLPGWLLIPATILALILVLK